MFTEDTSVFERIEVDKDKTRELFLKRTKQSIYTEYDRTIIFNQYVDVWWDTGIIHYLIPLSQMLHETGNLCSWWCLRPRRNPAGIGVTGSVRKNKPVKDTHWYYDETSYLWRYGVAFPDWGTAVSAQYGRLFAYTLSQEKHYVIQTFVDIALVFRPLPKKLQGSVTVLKELGAVHNKTGEGWADRGYEYGKSIAEVMNTFMYNNTALL